MRKIILIAASLLLIASMLLAQENESRTRLGAFLGGNFNMHSPTMEYDYSLTGGGNSIFDFDQNSTSLGINGGLIGIFPLNRILSISGRIGYHGMGATLEGRQAGIVNPDANEMDVSLHYLEISPILHFHNLIPTEGLYFLAGIEVGVPIVANYNWPVVYDDGTGAATLETIDSDIPDKSVRVAFALGAGYDIQLSKDMFLTPEVSFRLPMTNVSANDNFMTWNVPQLRLGVNLTFSLGGDEEAAEYEDHFLEVGFEDVRYYDQTGAPRKLDKITVEEVQYTEMFPIVPYVFCAENQAKPAPATQDLAAGSEAGEFTMNSLKPDALSINRSTLDIIGRRMQENERYQVTITGTRDSKAEQGKEDLSSNRAEFAKKYLVDNYNIMPGRITTKSRGLPEKASSTRVPDGVAENRRIEFTSPSGDLLKPITIERDKQTVAEPRMIEFIPYTVTTDLVTRWQLEIVQADKTIQDYRGAGFPDTLQWLIMPNQLQPSQIPLDYIFTAETDYGMKEMATGSIPVEYYSITRKKTEDRPDKTISKFSLIVFDFDSPEVSAKDREIINDNVIPAIKYNSTVQIYGYTDRIGEDEYNKRLAKSRAENVRKILEKSAPTAQFEVYGVGENILLYNNELPTGRHLSRTVQIYVITPKE